MWHHRGKAGGAPPCITLFFIRDLYHLYRSHKKAVSVRLTTLEIGSLFPCRREASGWRPRPFGLVGAGSGVGVGRCRRSGGIRHVAAPAGERHHRREGPGYRVNILWRTTFFHGQSGLSGSMAIVSPVGSTRIMLRDKCFQK